MKTHYLKLWIFIVGLVIVLNLNAQEEYTYRVPDVQWENSFGNHRAVLRIDQTSPVVSLDFHWRRHDREVEKHAFLIVNAQPEIRFAMFNVCRWIMKIANCFSDL